MHSGSTGAAPRTRAGARVLLSAASGATAAGDSGAASEDGGNPNISQRVVNYGEALRTASIKLIGVFPPLADIQAWDAASDARYDGPALFIAGADSDYIRPEHRPLIRSWFPRARFVTLKNAGHWLHADNPEGFVAVVEAFLAR